VEVVADVDAFGLLLEAAHDRRSKYNKGEKQRRIDSRKIAFASRA
jgi:hypothetical protein